MKPKVTLPKVTLLPSELQTGTARHSSRAELPSEPLHFWHNFLGEVLPVQAELCGQARAQKPHQQACPLTPGCKSLLCPWNSMQLLPGNGFYEHFSPLCLPGSPKRTKQTHSQWMLLVKLTGCATKNVLVANMQVNSFSWLWYWKTPYCLLPDWTFCSV